MCLFLSPDLLSIDMQLFVPFLNGGLRLRRHSIGQSNAGDYVAVAERRRAHYGSFTGLTDSVHPLCFVLPPDSQDNEPFAGSIPFARHRLPPPPPPPPPASRNENLTSHNNNNNNGFGKTMTIIEVNWDYFPILQLSLSFFVSALCSDLQWFFYENWIAIP